MAGADIQIEGVPANVAAGIIIPVGLIICFFGYRIYRVTLAIAGFLLLGSIAYAITYEATDADDTASWIAFAIGGVVGAVLAFTLFRLAVFVLGALGGAVLGRFLFDSFLYKISADHQDIVMWVSIAVCALAIGVLVLLFVRPGIIIISSWEGAYYAVAGVGFFIGSYGLPNKNDVEEAISGENPGVRDSWWAYFAATIVLALAGMFIQFTRTARGFSHESHSKDSYQYRAHNAV